MTTADTPNRVICMNVAVDIFSLPYLCNGRAVIMVVVCLSVCHGCIVAKRCEIGPGLLLIIDRESHIGFK